MGNFRTSVLLALHYLCRQPCRPPFRQREQPADRLPADATRHPGAEHDEVRLHGEVQCQKPDQHAAEPRDHGRDPQFEEVELALLLQDFVEVARDAAPQAEQQGEDQREVVDLPGPPIRRPLSVAVSDQAIAGVNAVTRVLFIVCVNGRQICRPTIGW